MKRAGLVLSILIALFGVSTRDPQSWIWTAAGIAAYGVPLAARIFRSATARAYGLWFGVFMVLQAAVSALYLNDYATLTPNTRHAFDVAAGARPGIEGVQVVTTDRMGFRVTKPVDYSRKAPLRIFAIGGSTTEQIWLDDRRTWAHLLQERLSARLGKNVEVVNTGVSGLLTAHHFDTLRRIRRMRADAVVILTGVNDWNRQIRRHFDARIKDEPTQWAFRRTMVGRTLRALALKPEHVFNAFRSGPVSDASAGGKIPVVTGTIADEKHSAARPVRQFVPESVSEEFETALKKIAEFCRKTGLFCLIANQPSGYKAGASAKFRESFWMTPPDTDYQLDFDSLTRTASLYNSHLLRFAGERGIPSCDLASALDPSFENFYDDCHFNTRGADRVASLLADCLTKAGLR